MPPFFLYIFGALTLIYVLIVAYYPYLHSKSYNHWVAIPQFLLLLVVIFGLFTFSIYQNEQDQSDVYGFIIVFTFFGIIFLAFRGTYLYYIVGTGTRRSGARQQPFKFKHLMYVGIAVMALLVGYGYFFLGLEGKYVWRFVLFGGGISAFLGYDEIFAKQKKAQIQTEIIPEAILFIRSFKTEKSPFWSGGHTKSPIPLPIGNTALIVSYPFMKYFGESFETHLAPIVGLGNPMDTIPGEGMMVSYEEDENWQEALLQQLNNCTAVIMTLGQSANLSWELNKIRELKMTNKFFIFTNPPQSAFWHKAHLFFLGLKKSTPSWQQFRDQMMGMKYELPKEEPAPGSILAFDKDCKSYEILTNALNPDEYVLAVKEHLHK